MSYFMNTATEKIQFRRIRDFGETIGVTTQFIYQNFKPLALSIAYTALPFVLLGSLLSSIASVQMYSGISDVSNNESLDRLMGSYGLFGIAYSFILIGFVLLFPTINEYAYLYATRSDYDQITPADVRRRVFANISTYITTFFAVMGIFFTAYIATIVAVILVIAMGSAMGKGMTWLAAIISLIVFTSLFAYIAVALSFSFVIRIIEKISLTNAISRCFSLLRGYGMVTFLLYFVTFCICMSISGLVSILSGMSMFLVGELNIAFLGILVLLLGIVSGLAQVVTTAITSLVSIFRYFSLVELKEATGLMQRVDEIGKDYENRYNNSFDNNKNLS